jgi:hypothetical protein
VPISNYFDIVWAVDGDITTIPDALDPSGFVSFTQGYTSNYQSPSGTYPIERDKFNYLMNQVTGAIQAYQQFGTPPFITSAMNGGSPFSYSAGARVLKSGVVYTSLTDSNTQTPPDTNWTTGTSVLKGGTGLTTITAHYLPIGNGTSPLTLLAPSAAVGIPLVSQGVSADPAYSTVIIAGGGTSATTALGAFDNLKQAATTSYAGVIQLGAQSLGTNGYQIFPDASGGTPLIIQWCTLNVGANTTGSGTWPIAFPTACYGAQATSTLNQISGGSAVQTAMSVSAKSTSGFTIANDTNTQDVYVWAVGK